MRKDANQMSCNGSAVLPASLLRQVLRVRIKLGCGDLRVFVKILLAAGKCLFNIAPEFVFQGLFSYSVGPPEVGFPFLEHRAKVEKDNVILTNRQVWRVLIVGSQSVAPRTHDAFVPIPRDSEHAPGKCIDTLINLAFLGPSPNQALRLDLCEERLGLSLSIQQPSDEPFFRLLHRESDYRIGFFNAHSAL